VAYWLHNLAVVADDAGIACRLDVKKSTKLNDTRLRTLLGLVVLTGALYGLKNKAALR
jgi:hypothetical protein